MHHGEQQLPWMSLTMRCQGLRERAVLAVDALDLQEELRQEHHGDVRGDRLDRRTRKSSTPNRVFP